MRRNSIIVAALILITCLSIICCLVIRDSKNERLPPQIFAASSFSFENALSTPTSIPSQASTKNNQDASSLITPIITGFFLIMSAVITGIFGLIQVRKTKKRILNKKKVKANDDIMASRIRTTREYTDDYKQKLLNDPFVANLQILTMRRPLQVTDVYVQLRLSQEEKPLEELALEARYDRVKLPKINHRQMRDRTRSTMEPGQAISSCLNKSCVIVGDPGSGKTTLLKYLAVKSAERKLPDLPDLPIYIELNAFASSGKNDLLDYASSNWQERYSIPKKEALKCIENNHILLLLDGLNETAIGESFEDAEASYRRVVTAIERVVTRRNIEASIVVTTRKADYKEHDSHQRPLLSGFTQLEVLDFRPEDIRKFVKSWFADHPSHYREEIAEKLNSFIEHNPRIQVLARNPLLLTEIAIVYEEDLELPQGRAELYKRCVDILLSIWNAERNLRRPRQFTLDNKKNLLKEIAWHFHLLGQRYFPSNELLSVIADSLPTMNIESGRSSQILSAIAIENGLLKEHAKEWYGFLHLTMQEFFVAQYIHDQDMINVLVKHCDEPWWEEVLFLCAAYKDASSLLKNLQERGKKSGLQKDIFHTNLILAGRCIATHAMVRDTELRETIVSDLFDVLTSTSYSLTRQQVVEILAETGGTNVNERLLTLLSDRSIHRDIQIAITIALGRVGEQSVAPNLLWMLSEQNLDKDICKHVADALGRMGNRSLVSSLLLYLQKSYIEDEVRESIADALGVLGASGKLEEVASDLVQLLSRKQINPSIRRRIAHALGKSGNHSLAPLMAELLSEETIEASVRMSIADALGALREPSVAHKLEQLLSSQMTDQGMRMCIADALGILGEHSSIHGLKKILLKQGENPDVRGQVSVAMGMLGDEFTAAMLLDLLSNPEIDTFLGQSIIIALGRLVERFPASELTQTISTRLLTMLSSSKTNSGIQIRIADFIGVFGHRTQTAHLLDILFDFSIDPQVREAIVDALGRLGEQAVATKLFELLSQPDVELGVRGHIAYVLCLLRYAAVVPASLKLLTEEKLNLQIRWLIADSLGVLGEYIQPSEIIPLLSKAEIDPSVRRHLVDVLALIVDDEESVLELATLLQSSDIADGIHRTLWEVSRRIGVRIVMRAQEPEIVRWRDGFDE